MASFCEKCKKTEHEHKVALKRCGQCKNVFYCGAECQKGDWANHKYHCRKPEAVVRKEAEKGGFMGVKNAVNVPVDIDPVTGDFDAKVESKRRPSRNTNIFVLQITKKSLCLIVFAQIRNKLERRK
jgi:hypothetical protein